MKMLLSDITGEGLDLELEETLEPDNYKLNSPVRASLRIDKVASEVIVNGRVRCNIELQCSRCLKNFIKDADVSVNVVYHPLEELKGVDKHEVKDDELDMGFYEGNELDIRELLKEQIILSVPMKPLCSEFCKGICPECGTDLNIDTCGCGQKKMDPRFEVLKNYLISERRKNGKPHA